MLTETLKCALNGSLPDGRVARNALCVLAHRMCSFYPELQHEFYATLNMMQAEHYKPGLSHLIKKYMNSKAKQSKP